MLDLLVFDDRFMGETLGYPSFSFDVDLKPVGNAATPYEVLACFEDNFTIPTNCTAWSKTPDGQDYAACTTVQYGYKPATKSISLTVTYQSTTITDPDDPEQLQQKLQASFMINTVLRFSLGYPWFWLETSIIHAASQLTIVTCTSLFDGWLQDYAGLENPLYRIFAGVSIDEVNILTSVAVSSITATLVGFVGGWLTTLIASGSILGSFLVQAGYFASALAVLAATNSLADAHFARAALIAAGWTLLTISTLGMARVLPILLSRIVGEDPVNGSIKSIINALIGLGIATAVLKVFKVSAYFFLFYILNLILGGIALFWGYSKT